MRKTHIGTALFFIPVALICVFWLIPANTVPPTSADDISPRFVPTIAMAVIGFYSLILLIREWRAPKPEDGELDEEFGAEATGVDARVLLNTLILLVVSALTWLGMNYIGFEPTMTVLIAVVMYYVGARNWLTIGLCAVIAPIVLSLCTFHFFSTELPGFWK